MCAITIQQQQANIYTHTFTENQLSNHLILFIYYHLLKLEKINKLRIKNIIVCVCAY